MNLKDIFASGCINAQSSYVFCIFTKGITTNLYGICQNYFGGGGGVGY